MKHEFMARAIELSREKMLSGEGGPFGAVIVHDYTIIAEGWNRVTSVLDPTAHAEVMAIRLACAKLQTFNLQGCEIYTSCEPCPMCLGAIYWARLDRIYYANTRQDAAAIDFDDGFLYEELTKPVTDRKIAMIQSGREDAINVFHQWAAKDDKISY